MDEITISTHNGCQVARAHNLRDPRVIAREPHIDPHGHFEIWHDEDPRAAYHRIFGEALTAYNAKQTKEERRISSYYDHIGKDEKRHQVYEMIVGVYGRRADGAPVCSASDGKRILRAFVDGWKDRNPNLQLIGAYYHADEEGEPHVHIDYIPTATGYKRGLSIQNSISKALQLQGFTCQGNQTEQMKWEARENQCLGQLCADLGLTVAHPGSKAHLDTELFKAQKQVEEMRERVAGLQSSAEDLRREQTQAAAELEYMRAQKSLSDAVREAYAEEQPIEILERRPAHKTLTGKPVPPTVTITESDFDALRERAQVSDWIRRAMLELKRKGDELLHQLNQKRIVQEARERIQEAEERARETLRQVESLSRQLRDAIAERDEQRDYMQGLTFADGFTCWDYFMDAISRNREREITDPRDRE